MMARIKKHKISRLDSSKILLSIFYIALLILPIIRMLAYIDKETLTTVMTSSAFPELVANSLLVAGTATLIVVFLAYGLTWSIERTKIKFKGLISTILVLPMLIPSISHGMGLIILFGNNGILTKLLKIHGSIYGKWGIILGSVIYAFPLAFLMFGNIMRYEDSSPYEAADVLGIGKWEQFKIISLPYLRKPLISIAFAVFTLIVTDYGVPIIVGGKFSTLPMVLYQEVIGRLDFAKGSVYGLFLLIPALIAFIFDLLNSDENSLNFVSKKFDLKENKIREAFAYIICGLTSLFVLMPIISFMILGFTKKYPSDLRVTFNNVLSTLNLGGGKYLLNSVIIGLMVALIGTVVAFITAYMTARMKTRFSKYLHLIAITTSAVPGIVLGLSYVLVFKGSLIYGQLAILIMVNITHFIASPYLMMYDSLNKLNENLEIVGHTLGIPRHRTILDVILPQSRETILEMISYFFINSMMTISAVSFLATTSNKPISLMINQFEAQMQLENAAVVSIMILIINIVVKSISYFVRKRIFKENKNLNLGVE